MSFLGLFRFQMSKLAGRTMDQTVILKMKQAFSQSFWESWLYVLSLLFRSCVKVHEDRNRTTNFFYIN